MLGLLLFFFALIYFFKDSKPGMDMAISLRLSSFGLLCLCFSGLSVIVLGTDENLLSIFYSFSGMFLFLSFIYYWISERLLKKVQEDSNS